MTANPLFDIIMNEQDIDMFIKSFDDFLKHSEVAIEEQNAARAHREEATFYLE